MSDTKSTSEATLEVSKALGCDLSPRDVDVMIRAWPVTEMPPLVRGRRRWGPSHLARLRREVEARNAKATIARNVERVARMTGDPVALAHADALARRLATCVTCGEATDGSDEQTDANGEARCEACARADVDYAVSHGILWRCRCGGVGGQDETCETCGKPEPRETCAECDARLTDGATFYCGACESVVNGSTDVD